MIFNANPRGFANGAHGFGRGQLMHIQSYRPTSYNRSISNLIIGQTSLSTENGSGENISVCQICHKSGHTADACWHRFVESYVPQPRNFRRGSGQRPAYMASFKPYLSVAGPFETQYCTDYSSHQMPDMDSMNHSLDSFSTPGAAYVANYEGPADEGWYLDNGATHHLTNNMANMHIREKFNGLDQLIIGNG